MGVLWPDFAGEAEDIGVLGRFGRVLHWAGLIVAAIPLAITAAVVLTSGPEWDEAGSVLTFLACWAAAWALLGRGLRWIFAGE